MGIVSKRMSGAVLASADASFSGRKRMSLNVSPDLLTAAERGEVSDADFVGCVRESLP